MSYEWRYLCCKTTLTNQDVVFLLYCDNMKPLKGKKKIYLFLSKLCLNFANTFVMILQ